MRIAVNARHMMKDRLEGIGTVTHEVMKRIATNHPDDQLDYYFDRKFHPDFIHHGNVKGHTFFPPARLPILIRYWLNHPVKKHVRKNHHQIFFSPDGFVPLKLDIPKISVVHDVAFLRNPMHITPAIRNFYDRWMPEFIREADHIITVSEFSKRELISGYHLSADKVSVVYNGVSKDFHPLSQEKQAEVRERYFGGNPFFLYLGAIHPRKNILVLIRAFEIFKNETKSDFKLVIAGRPSWYTKEVYQSFNSSQWRDDIIMTGFVEAEAAQQFLATAQALVYPSRYEGFGLPVVEAMASGTPVITSNVASLPEVAGDAALYFDPGNVEELVDHLKKIAGDETMRQQMIAAGCERIKKFSWDDAARSVYDLFQKFSA